MRELTEPQKAYIAGIIDGEGTISVTMHHQKIKSGIGEQILHKVAVSNTEVRLLEWLVGTTGLGAVKVASKSKTTKLARFDITKNKPLFIWGLWGNSIRQLLPEIIPYLVIKQRHATLMLDSLEQTKNRKGREYCGMDKGFPLTDKAKERRRWIVAEMKWLNRRGVVHASM